MPESSSMKQRPALSAVLLVLTAVLVLVFTPLAFSACRQAWSDWHSIPAEGVVAGIRLMRVDRPPPRANGPWRVMWEVECDPGGPSRLTVTAAGSYKSEDEAERASRHDPGRRVNVWHVPGEEGSASLHPPDTFRNLFAAVWTTAMAAMGWLGVAAFVQSARRRDGQFVETEPDRAGSA